MMGEKKLEVLMLIVLMLGLVVLMKLTHVVVMIMGTLKINLIKG